VLDLDVSGRLVKQVLFETVGLRSEFNQSGCAWQNWSLIQEHLYDYFEIKVSSFSQLNDT